MPDIWFISDTHFGHTNILSFRSVTNGELIRPGFRDVKHMDEEMIERWNSVVKDNDKVYHLGDVAFGERVLDRVMPRLKGRKRLLLGNHDKLDVRAYRRYFQKIRSVQLFIGDKENLGFICSHYPMHMDELTFLGRNLLNVHGHIHERTLNDPFYFNISVERINYTPIHYDELMAMAMRLRV